MAASLRLLYSANIAGDLWLLPRLYSFMQQLKAAAPHKTLLLDLGGSCSDSAWHCRATNNRSTLIALDGMGYHAANVEGALDAKNRDKLAEQVTLALVDGENPWRVRIEGVAAPIVFGIGALEAHAGLRISLDAAESTRLDAGMLRLESVGAGQVGSVSIALRGEPRMVSARVHDMPAGTQPNASIAGVVEFVEAEARYYFDMAQGKR